MSGNTKLVKGAGKMAEKIALVACVSKKAEESQPAADIYQSAWFKKASAYAKQNCLGSA